MIWVIASLLVILACQLFLMIGLSIVKHRTLRQERKQELAYDELLPSYLDYFLTHDKLLEEKLLRQKDNPYIIEKLLLDYTKSVKDTEGLKTLREFAEQKLEKYYNRLLKSRKWSNRMNAILAIERLRLTKFIKPLWKNLKSNPNTDEESILVMKTLARLGDLDLLNEILIKRKLSESEYEEIYSQYETEIIENLIAVIKVEKPSPSLCALIHFIGFRRASEHFQFVESYLNSESPRLRLCALDALKSMSQFIEVIKITPFLSSPIWEERVAATKICGLLKLNRHKQDLRKLMGDQIWTVRYTAGEAISQYRDGEMMLSHIAEAHEDRFARDMARQWIGAVS